MYRNADTMGQVTVENMYMQKSKKGKAESVRVYEKISIGSIVIPKTIIVRY